MKLAIIANYIAFPFVSGMVHGALTYKKEKISQLRSMAVSGSATSIALAAHKLYTSTTAAQQRALQEADARTASTHIVTPQSPHQEWKILNMQYGWQSAGSFHTKEEAEKVVEEYIHEWRTLLPTSAAQEERRKAILNGPLNFLIHNALYAVGNYAGRKLMKILDKKKVTSQE